MQKPYFLVTHAREDYPLIQPILHGLDENGYHLWANTMLQPGQNWEDAITEGLMEAEGLLLFITAASLSLPFVGVTMRLIADMRENFVLPILLEAVPEVPDYLAQFGMVDVSGVSVEEAVTRISARMKTCLEDTTITAPRMEALQEVAQAIAETVRGGDTPSMEAVPPRSIFIVHGHDHDLLLEVETFIRDCGIDPIVLIHIGGGALSLFQKFLRFSQETRFALVLMTADDFGASLRQYNAPGVGERALQFRARQNVLLELGFFYGYLGWENVYVLFKPPEQVFPNFEMPSDLGGVVFDTIDAGGRWKDLLLQRLQQGGFQIQGG